MESQTTTMSAGALPKFSRYRSVRKAGTIHVPNDAPPVPVEPTALNRAPSRYHRARRPTVHESPQVPAAPSTHATAQLSRSPDHTFRKESPATTTSPPPPPPPPATATATTLPPPAASRQARQSLDGADHKFAGGPVQLQRNTTTAQKRHERGPSRAASAATRSSTSAAKTYDAAREEARMILEGEYDRLMKKKDMQKRSERNLRMQNASTKSPPRQAPIEEHKPVDAGDAAARHNVQQFFDAPKHQVQRRPTVAEHKFIPAPQNIIRDQAPKPQAPKARTSEDGLMPVPVQAKFDAPVSAVNAGERRIEVRSSGASIGITLPVTPTTTARDLLNSASIVMSESFDPRTAILVESFSQVGLERPLRRYEHVREVMNSWDTDSQNYLTIMQESECAAKGLEKKDAPLAQPADIELQLHYALKPGKWEKRWVVLKSDGQVTVSKHEHDGDGVNICHLSDFDVYTPTRKQYKKLKPPKKICIAVKSQQKSSMFLEGANFVHFFTTGDRDVADQWYNAVQSWRSWYLVNVLGEGVPQKPSKTPQAVNNTHHMRPGTSNSQETIPYQLGSFQPLDFDDVRFGETNDDGLLGQTTRHNGGMHSKKPSMDMNGTRRSVDQRRSFDVDGDGPRRGSRQNRAPPCSFPGKLVSEARNKVECGVDPDEQQAFTGGGLLGRSVSRRSQTGRTTAQAVPGASGNKPLVDLAENSEFTDGSLLRKLEAWTTTQGESQPKIDRQKRVEANVRVGEGW